MKIFLVILEIFSVFFLFLIFEFGKKSKKIFFCFFCGKLEIKLNLVEEEFVLKKFSDQMSDSLL